MPDGYCRFANSASRFRHFWIVAHSDIEPTAEWQTQIQTALATCDAFIALLHPDFQASDWTDQEVGFSMGRGVPTFAVRLGQVPYSFMGAFKPSTASTKLHCTRW
jgi:nucleoside 2-deoxyribosyltransferase